MELCSLDPSNKRGEVEAQKFLLGSPERVSVFVV